MPVNPAISAIATNVASASFHILVISGFPSLGARIEEPEPSKRNLARVPGGVLYVTSVMGGGTLGPVTGQLFRAEEITEAYAAMHARVQEHARTGDWADFALNFTEDADYVEHAFGTFHGRDAIREWSVATMTSFPGGTMTSFPLAWQVVDEATSRLICEVRNLMPDPGDGSLHEAANLTIMTYAGNGLFSREEDVYNPLRFLRMTVRWAKVAEAHGRLDDEGRAYLATYARS
ncbi:SnoaL-like domain-containing protein [Nocardioides psychrotolerans]|uniref:SnoaL-like domain-containing protein n=1 Tax=Nocardioides psychrotolerans TaxID=1005945 RepID=A0A1I3E607_9ACTN|nr:SnoaL-like domain-containing protein [Nocardioides psychrotolerans]